MSAVHRPEYQYMLRQLRLARQMAGMTQAVAGEAIGQGQSFISACELGERRIDPVEFTYLMKLYKKPWKFFFPKQLK